jgi:hypothetical protein
MEHRCVPQKDIPPRTFPMAYSSHGGRIPNYKEETVGESQSPGGYSRKLITVMGSFTVRK